MEVQSNEKAAAKAANKLSSIESDIRNKLALLAEASMKKKDYQETLRIELKYLSQQIRAAYKIGQNDYLKLLLNLERIQPRPEGYSPFTITSISHALHE